MRATLSLIFILLVFFVRASSVDTVSIFSESMHKSRNCVVIRPDSYKKKSKRFPAVYLLHGYAGDYSNWIIKVPQLKKYADEFQLLIVCPDGDYSSWYFDSPLDTFMKFDTYISKEVPAYVDAHYHTIKKRNARAITGLSMGGHGAFFLAFRHADIFGACGSMSGGMDLRSSSNKYDISKRIGDTINYAQNWKNYSVIGVIENKPADSLAIIFDCGLDDGFFKDNRRLHEKLLQLKIAHDYIERPGNHSWNYWANSVPYQLLFFRNYFNRQKFNSK
jgi:S-formylglutathione hydrolase FrmB